VAQFHIELKGVGSLVVVRDGEKKLKQRKSVQIPTELELWKDIRILAAKEKLTQGQWCKKVVAEKIKQLKKEGKV